MIRSYVGRLYKKKVMAVKLSPFFVTEKRVRCKARGNIIKEVRGVTGR